MKELRELQLVFAWTSVKGSRVKRKGSIKTPKLRDVVTEIIDCVLEEDNLSYQEE